MQKWLARSLALVISGTLAPGCPAAEPVSSINIGIGGPNPLGHCTVRTYTIEYEHRLTPTLVVFGSGSNIDYRHDETGELEDGYIRGLDIGARYYLAGEMRGFYGGMSLGYAENGWNFINNRTSANPLVGTAESKSIRLNFDLGYRFRLGDGTVSIMPQVNFGKFFNSTSCDYTAPASAVGNTCDENSDVAEYIYGSVSLGMAL